MQGQLHHRMHASSALAGGCSALSSLAMHPPAQHSSEVQTPARSASLSRSAALSQRHLCKADTGQDSKHAGASEVWDNQCRIRVQG